MSPENIVLALKTLNLRERLIFRMAVFNGIRPGEILAIRLGNISDHSILIDQRVYRGNLDSPKGRKGKRTVRLVGLSPGTEADLKEWLGRFGEKSPDAFLFPSENLRTPPRRRFSPPQWSPLCSAVVGNFHSALDKIQCANSVPTYPEAAKFAKPHRKNAYLQLDDSEALIDGMDKTAHGGNHSKKTLNQCRL